MEKPGVQCRRQDPVVGEQHRCMGCGRLEKKNGRALDYVSKGLRVSEEEIRSMKRMETTACLAAGKLHLVLDLDHTLLHSTMVKDLHRGERYLIGEEGRRGDMMKLGNYLIKFRPFLFEFLREANELFELSVYTKGTREYAMEIVKFLDPQGTYFRAHQGWDRVITRDESPGNKTLDLVLADERGVIIVDDSREVWPENQENLLVIPPYVFFLMKAGPISSYSVQKTDEREDGWLATVLDVLKQIHALFLEQEYDDLVIDSRDVRPIMRKKLDISILK